MSSSDATPITCVKFIVAGKVQGVCFRAATRTFASGLGLSGHARNLQDGSVEVIACGSIEKLEALERWLRTGPPAARVNAVARQPSDAPAATGFHVL